MTERNGPLLSSEIPKYQQEFYGLKARLALATKDAIDPTKKATPIQEKDLIVTDAKKAAVTKAIADASLYDRSHYWQERARTSTELADVKNQWIQWENDFIDAVQDSDNQEIIDVFRSRKFLNLGWAPLLADQTTDKNLARIEVQKIKSRYFNGTPKTVVMGGDNTLQIPSNVALFLEDVRQHYLNADGSFNFALFRKEAHAIQWFAANFGATASNELITQWLETIEISQNSDERKALVKNANEVKNGNAARCDRPNLEEKEDFDIEFLHQHGNINQHLPDVYMDSQTDTDGAPPVDDTGDDTPPNPNNIQPLETKKQYDIKDIFGMVTHAPIRNTSYFVRQPPSEIDVMNPDVVKDLTEEAVQRSFVDIATYPDSGAGNYSNNPDVIPHAFEFGNNPNYQALERLTDNDSGLLALAGISAETHEKQAQLYRTLSLAIVQILKQNPGLLDKWLQTQKDAGKVIHPILQQADGTSAPQEITVTSYMVLQQFDLEKGVMPPALRPDDELLLSMPNFSSTWQTRIAELEQSLQRGELTLAQLRQIEFLSHCFDMKKLFKLAKEPQQKEKHPSGLKKMEYYRHPGKEHQLTETVVERITQITNQLKPQIEAAGSLIKALEDPATPQDLKERLKELYEIHLRASGIQPSSKASLTDLATLYLKQFTEERDKAVAAYSYEQFLSDNPFFYQENVEADHTVDQNGFPIDRFSLSNTNISFLHAKDKDEDSMGIRRNTDGSFSIVLADGVSGTAISPVASRMFVLDSLGFLEQNEPTQDLFKKVHDMLQEYNAPLVLRAYRKILFDRYLQTKDQFLYTRIEQLDEKASAHSYTASTLGALKYYPTNGEVKIATKSDVSVLIVRSDGSIESIENPSGSAQIYYSNDSNHPYRSNPSGEKVRNLKLNDGDMAVMYTDGLGELKDIKDDLVAFIKQHGGEKRRDILVREYIKDRLRALSVKSPNDDISVAIIEHTAASLTSSENENDTLTAAYQEYAKTYQVELDAQEKLKTVTREKYSGDTIAASSDPAAVELSNAQENTKKVHDKIESFEMSLLAQSLGTTLKNIQDTYSQSIEPHLIFVNGLKPRFIEYMRTLTAGDDVQEPARKLEESFNSFNAEMGKYDATYKPVEFMAFLKAHQAFMNNKVPDYTF